MSFENAGAVPDWNQPASFVSVENITLIFDRVNVSPRLSLPEKYLWFHHPAVATYVNAQLRAVTLKAFRSRGAFKLNNSQPFGSKPLTNLNQFFSLKAACERGS
jgi:hypothetical protein